MYGGHDGLVMLEMSGQGCRTFETLGMVILKISFNSACIM